MRVFLDANVLFSAALSARGTAPALLLLADTAGADCVSSAYAWAEAHRNLAAKAPHALHTLGLIETVVGSVPEAMAAHVERALAARVVAKDAPVLAAAIQCGAAVFVTADVRHFGHLFGKNVDAVLVLALRAALDHIAGLKPP